MLHFQSTKVLVAILIALSVGSDVTPSQVDTRLTAASSRMATTSVQRPREKFVMKVDRPFFFAIRDNRTGVVLFMGSIRNPSGTS